MRKWREVKRRMSKVRIVKKKASQLFARWASGRLVRQTLLASSYFYRKCQMSYVNSYFLDMLKVTDGIIGIAVVTLASFYHLILLQVVSNDLEFWPLAKHFDFTEKWFHGHSDEAPVYLEVLLCRAHCGPSVHYASTRPV